MRTLLLEGGVAGHLAHLYDNRELTANKMRKILSLASQGELVGTEKTDGYNIYLGFRAGKARWARNKGDMRAGGRSMEELVNRVFKGGPKVKEVYVNAFKAFEDFVNAMDDNVRTNIFGEDESIFYNTEIQGPGANNVVNYDANVVSIHHGNHKRYDAETDSVEIIDAEEQSRFLDGAINQLEQSEGEQDFKVRRTAVLQLRKLSDDTDLRIALAKIEKAGFIGDMTIEEYLESKILPIVQNRVSYMGSEVHQMIVDYMLGKANDEGKKVNLRDIYKGFPPDQRVIVRDLAKSGSTLIKAAVWPIEDAIHDFAVELLKGLNSAYILDNPTEVSRLKAETEAAVKAIQSYSGEGADEARNVLAHQLRKIKHLDNINSTVEGFVFHHDGQMYKFTGNFAPVNQILGLFRYGRGSVPAISRDKPTEVNEVEEVEHTEPDRIIAIIPGAFKPPHKGHFAMALHYAGIADSVAVYISRLAREGVEFDTSRAIWEIYVNTSPDPRASKIQVIPEPSDNNSPVGAALEFVGNDKGSPHLAQPGDYVILGASDKKDNNKVPDYMRFKDAKQYYAHGVLGGELEDTKRYAFKVSGEPLSARDLRKAIRAGDMEVIKRYVPEHVLKQEGGLEAILGALDIGAPGIRNESLQEIIFRLVEETLDEKLKAKDGAGAYVKDFYKSDAPQFDGKSKEKRREMAVAAFMQDKEESEESKNLKEAYFEEYDTMSDYELITMAEREGIEEFVVSDGEGGLVNREEIIDALKAIDSELTETSCAGGGAGSAFGDVAGGTGVLKPPAALQRKKKRRKLNKEALIQKVMDYLLVQDTHANG